MNSLSNITTATAPTPVNKTAPLRTKLPLDYLNNGYRDEAGSHDLKLLTVTAEQLASTLYSEGMSGQDFASLFRWIRSTPWTNDINQLKLWTSRLIIKAQNLVKNKKAPHILVDFFKANFSAIEASDDFNFFMNHFEAVACYLNALENETSDARED